MNNNNNKFLIKLIDIFFIQSNENFINATNIRSCSTISSRFALISTEKVKYKA